MITPLCTIADGGHEMEPTERQPERAGQAGPGGMPPGGAAWYPAGRPGPAYPPTAPWAPPPPKATSRVLVWSLAGVAIVLLGCVGVVAVGMVAVARDGATRPGVTAGGAAPGLSAPSASVATDEEAAESGPTASTYPVREADDLERVCEDVYYPQSPKLTTKGSQPVKVFVNDDKTFDVRTEKTLYDIPGWGSRRSKGSWDPAPGKARLVACVDLTTTGKRVRTCRFDDPKPATVQLVRATYRFALYEVATGRKLLDKRLTGDADDCPSIALIAADRKIYSTVSDRQIYETLRRHVER